MNQEIKQEQEREEHHEHLSRPLLQEQTPVTTQEVTGSKAETRHRKESVASGSITEMSTNENDWIHWLDISECLIEYIKELPWQPEAGISACDRPIRYKMFDSRWFL